MTAKNFELLTENLQKKGYQVSVFDNKESASEYLNAQIDGQTVGLGGSVTLRQMDLFNSLSAHNTVFWHEEKPEDMTVLQARGASTRADIYISSVNGISEGGEIVNIDNTGNRVAAIAFGPSKIYLVIGSNKVAQNLEGALHYARNVAAPLNAQRLNKKTPCAVKADKCYDCKSPDRICRVLSVFWDRPTGAEYEVVLVKEELGY